MDDRAQIDNPAFGFGTIFCATTITSNGAGYEPAPSTAVAMNLRYIVAPSISGKPDKAVKTTDFT